MKGDIIAFAQNKITFRRARRGELPDPLAEFFVDCAFLRAYEPSAFGPIAKRVKLLASQIRKRIEKDGA